MAKESYSTDPSIPLLINGKNVSSQSSQRTFKSRSGKVCQGATKDHASEAIRSAESAFAQWSRTSVFERRELLKKLASLLAERGPEIRRIIEQEILCDALWSHINLQDTIGMIEEIAALLTSEALHGSIPHIRDASAQALVFQEPLGVILGMAPWNAPLILGMRAVLTPIATGNTAILKGSELSPETHFFIAELFRDAGFPPGVVNFIVHRPEDAVEVFDTLINDDAVRKCNFTGSTAVGRIIAEKAGAALTPVLLELGGKNCSIVLANADVDKAAESVLIGATLNNGQICMSTDIAIVAKEIAEPFKEALKRAAEKHNPEMSVINPKSAQRLQSLVKDAADRGAEVWQDRASDTNGNHSTNTTVVIGVSPEMRFFKEESFGPMVGVVEVESAQSAVDIVNSSGYGLSCSVWTSNQREAIEVSRQLRTGAVHVNASTVHDEPTLPHGGVGLSGYGRFGAAWGIREFVQTKTVILH
ncbi:ALDH-like protein, partial [Myriangium duriaei CBS 260.36]